MIHSMKVLAVLTLATAIAAPAFAQPPHVRRDATLPLLPLRSPMLPLLGSSTNGRTIGGTTTLTRTSNSAAIGKRFRDGRYRLTFDSLSGSSASTLK
jgi:hypothetical protein